MKYEEENKVYIETTENLSGSEFGKG